MRIDKTSFLASFWHGDARLALAFWLVGPLLLATQFIAPPLLIRAVAAATAPAMVLAVVAGLALADIVGRLWWSIGVWRAAGKSRRNAKATGTWTVWSHLARLVVLMMALQFSLTALLQTGPILAELVKVVAFNDPGIPDFQLRLLNNGSEIELDGGIKLGLAAELAGLLDSNPDVTVLHLNSGGGRVFEAAQVSDLVRQHRLDTFVRSNCASACGTIFLAGANRFATQSAQLGFHSYRFPGMNARDDAEADRRWQEEMLLAGIDPGFVRQALTVPATQMWYPVMRQLTAANVVTEIVASDRFAASQLADSWLARSRGDSIDTAQGMLAAYQGEELLNALGTYFPDELVLLLAEMQRLLDTRAAHSETLDLMGSLARNVMRKHADQLGAADPALVLPLVKDFGAMLRAIDNWEGAGSCQSFVGAGLAGVPPDELPLYLPQMMDLAGQVVLAAASGASRQGMVPIPSGSDWQAFFQEVQEAGHDRELIERLNAPDQRDPHLCQAFQVAIEAAIELDGGPGARIQAALLEALASI